MEKRCSKCGEIKPIEEFGINRSREDGRAHDCLKCHRLYCRNNYLSAGVNRRNRIKVREQKLKKFIGSLKSKLSCVECGENHPACLDFHHNDSSDKDFNIGNAWKGGWSEEKILKEVSKCSVLCSNCHRKLHFGG